MSFTVNVRNRVRIHLGWLNDAEQRELGSFAIDVMKRRIQGGIGVNDQPAPRLATRYEKAKVKKGRQPIRDLTLTGATLNNFQVIETGDALRLGFPDPQQALKAGINQGRFPMIGLSRFDQSQVIRKHDELMARSISEMIQILVA